jgi:HSP20 family protein
MSTQPRTDIFETPEAFLLLADVPGAAEDGVDVTLENDVLTVSAKTTSEEPQGYAWAHREYASADYQRQFTVAAEIDRDRIEATLHDGVLRVTLPKAARAKTRKITVQTGG